MTLQTWLTFVLVAILPAVSPGPAILMALSNSLRFGPRSVVYSALGNALGLIVLGFGVAFGLAAIMKTLPAIFVAIKIFGAAYLFYLGLKLWRNETSFQFDESQSAPSKSHRLLFFQALLLSLTNPKGLVLLAVLLPPFVDQDKPVLTQVGLLCVTFAIMCFGNHMFIAFTGAKVRAYLASARFAQGLRRILGGLFMVFGASLALSAR